MKKEIEQKGKETEMSRTKTMHGQRNVNVERAEDEGQETLLRSERLKTAARLGLEGEGAGGGAGAGRPPVRVTMRPTTADARSHTSQLKSQSLLIPLPLVTGGEKSIKHTNIACDGAATATAVAIQMMFRQD
jgi:hypothetical protein